VIRNEVRNKNKEDLSKEEKEKLDRIKECVGTDICVDVQEDGVFVVAGATEITPEEAEDKEKILEKLRTRGGPMGFKNEEDLSEEEREKLERVRKYATTDAFVRKDGIFDVGGRAVLITSEEAEDEETIKEKLRAMGYLGE